MTPFNQIRMSPCPHCHFGGDLNYTVGDPKDVHPGDLSVCIRCGGVSRFNEVLTRRHLTEIERLEIVNNDAHMRVIMGVRRQLGRKDYEI